MNDTKKPKISKEIKHLLRICVVAEYALNKGDIPPDVTEKKLKKSLKYFAHKVDKEIRNLNHFHASRLTKEQEERMDEPIEKLFEVLISIAAAKGSNQDENAE